jgi:hypothetical protein
MRQVPWIFAICGELMISVLVFQGHAQWYEYIFSLLFILTCFLVHKWKNRVAKVCYANHKMILQLLEEKYGDTLPWLVEQRALTSAHELEVKIVRENQASHA